MKTDFRLAKIMVLTAVSLLLFSDANAKIFIYDNNIPIDIPDEGTVFSDVNVLDSNMVADVNVVLNITHSWDADLDVYLVHNDVIVELFTDVGGSLDDFRNTVLDDEAYVSITEGSMPFTGSFQPEGNLSDFDGLDAQGLWQLVVTDDDTGDTGTLESWSLILKLYSYPANPSPVDCANDISVHTCLSWDAGCDPNSTTWDLYLGKDPNEMELIATDLNEPNYCPCGLETPCGLKTLCGLETWTWYFWKVVAKYPSRKKVPGKNIWSFQTECLVDLNRDGTIDFDDVYTFIEKWLEAMSCTVPP